MTTAHARSTKVNRRARIDRQVADEESQPPTDLRLVPMALAVWAGALAGLSAAHWWWTFAGCCVVALLTAASVPIIRRQRWWPGTLVATSAGVASLLISLLYWHFAADNPLTAAAARGSFATVALTVTAAPRQLPNPFPVGGSPSPAGETATTPADETASTTAGGSASTTAGGSASTPAGGSASSPAGGSVVAPTGGSGPATQWLISGRAELAVVADREFEPAMPISVIAIGQRWAALIPGEQIRVAGLLAPDPYSVLPGVTLKARSAAVALRAAPWWQRMAASVREHLEANAAPLSEDARGLLPGLVVGNTDSVTPELKADAKLTGLTHLLAVSGSHFALLCGLTVVFLRRAGPRFAAAGGALVLLGLVALVGPGASVLRAAVMGAVALIAMSTGRNRTALPALATAAICLLLYDPTLSRSVGFALSVLATAGLILLAPVWSKALQRHGLPAGWADLLAVPAAAFVTTMPVIAALSGAISLASIPANLLAAPVVGPALVIGMASALTGPGGRPRPDRWPGRISRCWSGSPSWLTDWPDGNRPPCRGRRASRECWVCRAC